MIEGPYKLPKGWRWVRLGEVCEIIMGQSPPSKSYNTAGRGLPFFQGKADFGEIYPTPRVWCDAPKKIARMNDILISVRAPVGAVNIAKDTCCIGRGLAALRLKAECELFWLFCYLKFIEKYLAEKGSGSTFKAITKKDIENLFIPLPPLDEQKRIVARVEELMSKIKEVKKLREETKKQTELLWQSVLAETFPQPGTQLPNGWRWVRLGEIAIVFSGTWGKDPSSQGNDEEALVRVIRVSDIKETLTIDYASVPWRCVTQKEVKRLALRDGDVIVVKSSGSQAKVISGRAALFEQQSEIFLPSNFVFAVRCNAKEVSPRFLWSWLNSEPLKQVIKQMVATFTYPNLKKSDYVNLPIPLPPLEEQKRIANYLQEVHEKIQELKEVQAKTEEEIKLLEQSILEKAFRGEL